MAVKLEMMRVFRAVARHGSLADAANELARTVSAVSMMLGQFEDNLGAPLFETERKNRLTSLGVRVLEECERSLETFDRSVDAMARHVRSIAGIVRVCAVPSALVTVLPSAIARFQATVPHVRMEISDADSAGVRLRLQLDEADLGIVSEPDSDAADAEVLLEDALGIICRPDMPVATAARNAPSWDLLSREPLIANPLCAMVDHPLVRTLLTQSNLYARNTTTMLAFVRDGLGVTILPENVMRAESTDLVFVRPADPPAIRRLVLHDNLRRTHSPAILSFRGTLIETCRLRTIFKQPIQRATAADHISDRPE